MTAKRAYLAMWVLGAALCLLALTLGANAQQPTPQEIASVQALKLTVMQQSLDQSYLALTRVQEALAAAQKRVGEWESYSRPLYEVPKP